MGLGPRLRSWPDSFMDKVPATIAGYMELPGAVKDADCKRVKVSGGVSKNLACCNLFDYDNATEKKFSCGTCEQLEAKESRSRPSALDRLRKQ